MIQVMAADHAALGAVIKKRRQALGFRSQQELADRIGVTRTTVSDWENGRHYPARYIGALEAVLGICLSVRHPEPDATSPPRTPEEEAIAAAFIETLRRARARGQGNNGPA